MRLFSLTVIILLLASCSTTKEIQSRLEEYKSPMGYLHNGYNHSNIKTKIVYIKSINYEGLHDIVKVSHLYTIAIPFLFYNYFETNAMVELGQNSIDQDYITFFKNSVIEDSKRSGYFELKNGDTSKFKGYNVELSIDTCITKAKYKEVTTLLVVAYGYSSTYAFSKRVRGLPSETKLHVKLKLRQGLDVILEKDYYINKTQPYPYLFENTNLGNSEPAFMSNMAESLSLSTKQVIEEIITDVNNSINNN